MREMSSKGSPTEERTNIMVMRPAEGTDAAPTDAAVAVKLEKRGRKMHWVMSITMTGIVRMTIMRPSITIAGNVSFSSAKLVPGIFTTSIPYGWPLPKRPAGKWPSHKTKSNF
jgi:hypothetical protein